MNHLHFLPAFALLAATPALASLAVGPDFKQPPVETPAAFRDLGSWKASTPTTPPAAPALADTWWKAFGDTALDDLVARALADNQDLRAAAARVEQARAAAGLARAAFFPSIQVDAFGGRVRSLDTAHRETDYADVPLTLGYELDLWGSVRRGNQGARAEAAAQASLFAASRLGIAAQTAQTYFALRASEREEAIVLATVATRRDGRDLITARFKSGSAAEPDVALAETELATAEADLAGVQQRRAALQNALAVLVGAPAPAFEVSAPASATTALPASPAVPPGLPGELLERRPDIHAAQLALVASNARIGVARAAFFPAVQLTGSGGYESADLGDVFRWDQRVWSFGPRLYLPVFQGGRNRANLARARAAYDESVASYRASVLVAFREVQDALTATRFLAAQSEAQARAAASARRAAQLSRIRYDSGYVGYLEVVDSERSALAAERAVVQLGALRLFNTITLIKALGGGWSPAPNLVAAR